MEHNIKSLSVGAAMLAMTTAAQAQDVHCIEPSSLIGLEVTEDGAIFNMHQDGADVFRFTLGMPELPEGVVELQDLVEEGIISQGMADFMNSDLQSGMIDRTEEARLTLLRGFNNISIFITPTSKNVAMERTSTEGVVYTSQHNLNNNDDLEDFKTHYGESVLNNVNEIVEKLKNTMIGHAEVVASCALTTVKPQNGILKP